MNVIYCQTYIVSVLHIFLEVSLIHVGQQYVWTVLSDDHTHQVQHILVVKVLHDHSLLQELRELMGASYTICSNGQY